MFFSYLCIVPMLLLLLMSRMWGMHIYRKGVYLTLNILALQNFTNSEYPVENKVTVDACVWYVFAIVVYSALWRDNQCVSFRRGSMRCSFELDRVMRRPCRAGRAKVRLLRFFIYMD